ncbi:hypothetical protein HYR99_06620 [Candidatus Poribacteria bacterium]|nr:hypothetical protein [Candidatus Poribacteria bacterium]
MVKARQERTVEKETDMRIASGPSVPQYQQDIQKSQTWVQQEPQPQETPIRQEAQSQPLSHLMQQRPQPQKAQHNLTPMQEFGHLYNAAVEDSKRHSEFAQRYQPVRIGVANAMERRRDSSKEPDFQTSPYGDYFAVVVEGGTRYAVVPRFALTFQESSYGPGAMGQVFECPNYDIRQRYPRVKVVKPAVFEPDPARQRWTLKEKGVLDLGQGE